MTVILVGDMPLRSQVGAISLLSLSAVQVEKTCLDDNGILVTGWEFWRQQQVCCHLPLLVIAAAAIAGKSSGGCGGLPSDHASWFRLYLLPAALSELQRAIAPVRERQGVVALLDSRVLHRSYGSRVLLWVHWHGSTT